MELLGAHELPVPGAQLLARGRRWPWQSRGTAQGLNPCLGALVPPQRAPPLWEIRAKPALSNQS